MKRVWSGKRMMTDCLVKVEVVGSDDFYDCIADCCDSSTMSTSES